MELCKLHKQLTEAEYKQLEKNCLEDGRIIDPIITWNGHVIDGMHRLEIAKKHNLPYTQEEVSLKDEDEAKLWVIDHQLGRRNIDPFEQSRLRAMKAKLVGDIAVVAKQHGVSERTVRRDIGGDRAINSLPEDIRQRCEQGNLVVTRKDLLKYDSLSDVQKRAVNRTLAKNPEKTFREALPKKLPTGLTPKDLSIINASALSPQAKESIALGTITVDHRSIGAFSKLRPEEQVIVGQMLVDPDIASMEEAIYALGESQQKSPAERAKQLRSKIDKLFSTIKCHFDDLLAINRDDTQKHRNAIDAINNAIKAWEQW